MDLIRLFEGFLELLFSFIFPSFCKICHVNGRIICQKCFYDNCYINIVQKCVVCSLEVRSGLIHEDCKESTYLDGLLFITLYSGVIKIFILEAKYKGVFSNMKDIGFIMSQYYKNYNLKNVIVTSVPLNKKRLKTRGFNQAEILARSFCKYSNLEYRELLKRTKNTKTQIGMSYMDRMANIKNVFSLIDNVDVKGLNFLIIDDVFTTGSTMGECAKVLKKAGANFVYGYSFSKARL